MILVHLSDLHIDTDRCDPNPTGFEYSDSAAFNVQAIREMFASIADGASASGEETILVLTGDTVDDGDESQIHAYLEARNLLRGLPVVCVPGNHEYGYNGNYVYSAAATRFWRMMADAPQSAMSQERPWLPAVDSGYVPMVRSFPIQGTTQSVHVVGLDSMREQATVIQDNTDYYQWGGKDLYAANGELGTDQLESLKRTLAKIHESSPNDPIVVLLHHDPEDTDATFRLEAREAFYAAIRGNITVLLFGHTEGPEERPNIENTYSIPLVLQAKGLPYHPSHGINLGVLWGEDLCSQVANAFQLCDADMSAIKRKVVCVPCYMAWQITFTPGPDGMVRRDSRPMFGMKFFPRARLYARGGELTTAAEVWRRCQRLAHPSLQEIGVDGVSTWAKSLPRSESPHNVIAPWLSLLLG